MTMEPRYVAEVTGYGGSPLRPLGTWAAVYYESGGVLCVWMVPGSWCEFSPRFEVRGR